MNDTNCIVLYHATENIYIILMLGIDDHPMSQSVTKRFTSSKSEVVIAWVLIDLTSLAAANIDDNYLEALVMLVEVVEGRGSVCKPKS